MDVIDTTDAVARFAAYAGIPEVLRQDALLRIEADPAVLYGAWTLGDGYAFASVDGYGGDPCWLNVVGPAGPAAVLADLALAELAAAGTECYGVTVPRELVAAGWTAPGDAGDGWDLMLCDTAPPARPGEERVRPLEDLEAVQAFLERVNPHHSVNVEHPEVECWLGVTDEATGAPLALGAFTRRRFGTAYLASIATTPEARGRGLGAAVTAALTRHAFASGDALCTLAHFHPNDPARRIYLRLGYRTTHRLSSRRFPREKAAS
jgi:ribosomal protein S18 acetylase RimI-like enzyme